MKLKPKDSVATFFTGSYHSAFKGRGMSFSEVRSYQYGDDVRNIDWNVTARSGDTLVKVFEEERELAVMLVGYWIDESFLVPIHSSNLNF